MNTTMDHQTYSRRRGAAALDSMNGASVLNVLNVLRPAENKGSGVLTDVLFRADPVLFAERQLIGERQAAPEYPVAALGPLSQACDALANIGQIEPAMAGQSLLTVASLLTQAHRDVETLDSRRSLSLFALTLGLSGDGKSAAERVALKQVQSVQAQRSQQYKEDVDAIREAPKGEKAEMPRAPYTVMMDATIEGIRRSFAEGMPSQGCFTSEAAAILSGYGMSAEMRAKTAATLNGLWDNGTISVARGTAGRIEMHARRFASHWMLQPGAAAETLNDPALSAIGFWPRFLLAAPAPSKPRKAQAFHPENNAHIRDYWQRCQQWLDIPVGEDCAGLPTISADSEALSKAGAFFERMEREAKTVGGALVEIRPFALRATEQAFRVAGVLAAWDGRNEIGPEQMTNALRLVGYSLDCWRLQFLTTQNDTEANNALSLYRWLVTKQAGSVEVSKILQFVPSRALRSRSVRDNAIGLLKEHGLVVCDGRHLVALGSAGAKAAA